MFARDSRQKFRRIQHTLEPYSKFVEILLNSCDFLYTGWPSFEGQPVLIIFSGAHQPVLTILPVPGLKQEIVDADADIPPEGLPVASERQVVRADALGSNERQGK
jgi:hypothetical protein